MISPTGYAIANVAGILSLISCIFVNYLILKHSHLRNNIEGKHIFILLTFYIFISFSTIIPYFTESEHSGPMCRVQGMLIQFFNLNSILWTGYLTLYRYYDTILNKKVFDYKKTLVVIICISILSSIIPFAIEMDAYGQGPTWCWYNRKKKVSFNILIYMCYYGIAWVVIIWITYVFTYMIYQLKVKGVEAYRISYYKYFPIILVIFFLPLTLSRIVQSSNEHISPDPDSHEDFYGYFIFSACLKRLLGLFTSLVYGLNPEMRAVLERRHNNDIIEIELKPARISQI